MKKKEILQYLEKENFCIIIPVYYECESLPAWRVVYTGTKEECKRHFEAYPDFLKATNEENNENRRRKKIQYLFFLEIGKKKEAEKIRIAYGF